MIARLSIYMPLILPRKITQIVILFYCFIFFFCTEIRKLSDPELNRTKQKQKKNENDFAFTFTIFKFEKTIRLTLLCMKCSTQITCFYFHIPQTHY